MDGCGISLGATVGNKGRVMAFVSALSGYNNKICDEKFSAVAFCVGAVVDARKFWW